MWGKQADAPPVLPASTQLQVEAMLGIKRKGTDSMPPPPPKRQQ